MTQSQLKSLLHYNPETGIFTRDGKEAGTTTPYGYRQQSIKKKLYLAHRLAWLYVYGEMPKNDIDHINHDRLDNRISNLRCVSRGNNLRNISMRKENTSGYLGVGWNKEKKKWQAQITYNYKAMHLGYYLNKEDAIIAREQANVKYGFHPNHGV